MVNRMSTYLRRIAGYVLGATLTTEELKRMITSLGKMLNKGYFIDRPYDPLTLQMNHHLSTNFFGYDFSGLRTISDIFERIEILIETTGKVGNKGMEFLHKSLIKSPKWKVKFKGLDHDTAKHKAHQALEFLNEEIYKIPTVFKEKSTISPEELKEMKERGVI